jgi:gluconate 2-dehydrogenase gamma chain
VDANLNRRDLLKALTAVAIAPLQLTAADPSAPVFFTKDDFALLDTVTELIIPADEHSPGARGVGVASYIDRKVAEAFDPDEKTSWNKGLALLNNLAREKHGRAFLETKPDQQKALLTNLAKNERDPHTDGERFFGQLKNTTAFVYYSSSIGIHQEMNYLGNVILQEFQGFDAT